MIFLCVNIAFRARAKGLKPLGWALATIAATFGGLFVGMIVVVITWARKYGTSQSQLELMQQKVKSGELTLNDWNLWFVLVCSFGGYLLVRYLLDKRAKEVNPNGDDLPS